jgi:predicted AAA+ superfamily ATPase
MDTEDVAVFVTGSSSRVLTRDLATALRGRSLTWEVFPLSFRECLAFRRIAWVPANADSESAVKAAFEQYLLWGGFPEIVLADDAMRPLILAEYASLMFYRDLVERYHVRNEPLMREMLRHAYRHTAGLLSISKLHRDLQSLGLAVSKQTVIDYLAHLADSFLLFLLPKQERSLRKQAHNPKKLHVIDPGLVTAFQVDAGRDLGHRLETAVFLELRRRQPQWYYYANGSEIDLCDGDGASFYNCCWALTSPETVARERQAMALGRARWPRAAGHLLYHEHGLQARAALPEAEPAWRLLATPPQAPSLASASKG